jgi:hypothetical protein
MPKAMAVGPKLWSQQILNLKIYASIIMCRVKSKAMGVIVIMPHIIIDYVQYKSHDTFILVNCMIW